MSVQKRRAQKRSRAAYVKAYLCRQGIRRCGLWPICNEHQMQGDATR